MEVMPGQRSDARGSMPARVHRSVELVFVGETGGEATARLVSRSNGAAASVSHAHLFVKTISGRCERHTCTVEAETSIGLEWGTSHDKCGRAVCWPGTRIGRISQSKSGRRERGTRVRGRRGRRQVKGLPPAPPDT
jgi:hypothetical protein